MLLASRDQYQTPGPALPLVSARPGAAAQVPSLSKLCSHFIGECLPVALNDGPGPHLGEGDWETAADEGLHGVTGLGVGHRVHSRPPLDQPLLRLHLPRVGVHHLGAGVRGVHHLGLRAARDSRHVGAAGWELDTGGRGLLLVRGGCGRGRGGHVACVIQVPAPRPRRLS